MRYLPTWWSQNNTEGSPIEKREFIHETHGRHPALSSLGRPPRDALAEEEGVGKGGGSWKGESEYGERRGGGVLSLETALAL